MCCDISAVEEEANNRDNVLEIKRREVKAPIHTEADLQL